MSEIVNLRQARKARHRANAEVEAAANRLRHGRTRGEQTGQAMMSDQARRLLDGALLDSAPRLIAVRPGDPTADHDE